MSDQPLKSDLERILAYADEAGELAGAPAAVRDDVTDSVLFSVAQMWHPYNLGALGDELRRFVRTETWRLIAAAADLELSGVSAGLIDWSEVEMDDRLVMLLRRGFTREQVAAAYQTTPDEILALLIEARVRLVTENRGVPS